MINEEQTRPCYDAYVKATGLKLQFTLGMRYYFERLCFEGRTAEDVTLVVNYIKRRIKEGRRERESLLPRNLLADTQKFAEDLSIAKSEHRAIKSRPQPAKQAVLNATGRPFVPPDNVKSAGQVMEERGKLASMLKEWREKSL